MRSFILLVFSLQLLPLSKVRGQVTNVKCFKLPASKEFVVSDSLTIIPGSVRIIPAEHTSYEQDLDKGQIRIRNESSADTLTVCYQVMPYALNHAFYNRPIEEYDSGYNLILMRNAVRKPVKENQEEIFHSEGLNKSGAISRGISFGNTRDLYVNSVLNLQMEGKLSESMNIRASITDQNIPYQPEGNTVLVQDFDNVFIELYNDKFSLTGGDMKLKSMNSYFLNYQRNVQGAQLRTFVDTGKSGKAISSIAVSAAKGRFSSYTIEPADGVLGPYRIYGPAHEKFMIILANSERVFLDGRQLQRGFNNDYVIDYNTAELTFTSRVLITRYSRIVVDFQYNDQSYGRSLVTFEHQQKIGRFGINLNYYREKDDPSHPFALDLSDNQKLLLGGIQSNGNYGLIPGADSVGFDPGKVLYKKIDTLIATDQKISIYIHTSNPDSAVYQVYFREAGSNKGNYRKQIIASGYPVYDWIMPDNGIPQGNFEPLRTVPLPSKKQMFDISTTYDLSKYEKVSGEFAVSGYDNNLFSSMPDNDHSGSAVKMELISRDRPLSGENNLFYNGGIDLEYTGYGFSPIDRYRSVEFDRDWSFDPVTDTASSSDLILKLKNGIRNRQGFINHNLSRRIKKDFVQGWQNTLDGAYRISKIKFAGDFYMMNNEMSGRRSDWLRYHLLSQYDLGYITPGYQYSSDRNVIYNSENDSITGSAMNYDEHLFFIKNSDSLKTRFGIQYAIRKDKVPYSGELVKDNRSNTFGFNIDHGNLTRGRISLGMYLRKLYDLNSTNKQDKTLNGNIDWTQPFFRNHLRSELTYSVGSGRELKREYTYIEVPGGLGTHTWRDENADGIKQLDEFYPAINDDERNYIKIFIPTDEYITAFDNILNYRLTADMPEKWQSLHGIRGLLSKFSNQLSITANQKSSEFGLLSNIFDHDVNSFDPRVISQHGRLRNTVYFNRKNPGFGMEITYDMANNKNIYSQGFEARVNRNITMNTRVNFKRKYSGIISINHGNNTSGSDYLITRNYLISSNQLNTSISWQPANFYRLTANLSQSAKKSDPQEIVAGNSGITEGGLNLRISKANDKAVECQVKYTHIVFNGNRNSPAGYELLNGLQPGNNISWSLNWQQKLINGLQMNIFYEGRKSGDLGVIHMGRMQVTALF